jgi:hypothetical protein
LGDATTFGGASTERDEREEDEDMSEGKDDDEYIITRIEGFKPALTVINCYGEQRGTRKEEAEGKFPLLLRARNLRNSWPS